MVVADPGAMTGAPVADHPREVAFSTCALHVVHIPEPLVAQLHHTFPKYLQAQAYGISENALLLDPRFDGTLASVCGTGHDSVHELIRRILRGDKVPKARGKTVKLARYAVERYQAAVASR